jgi:hypothetical protein
MTGSTTYAGGRYVLDPMASGGVGAAWFNDDDVAAFAAKLSAYPLMVGEPTALSGGFHHAGNGYTELVGLSVEQTSALGQIALAVHLADAPDYAAVRSEVRLQLRTTYQRLSEFSSDLLELVGGQRGSAEIGGETLA